jgi:hemolysin III
MYLGRNEVIMFTKLRDPVSGLTHSLGSLLSIAGLVLLVYFGATRATTWHIVGFAVFGASLILLYTASSLYHLLPLSERGVRIFRKIDHMMIFVLIAGTYTPICLVPLRGGWGFSILSVIWTIAVAGIVMKVFWLHAPRWIYTGIYLLMGWLVLVAFWPLIHTIPPMGLVWFLAGGLFYTLGAVIYAIKKPNVCKNFGFHEIFHLFVMAGSLSHFWLMFRYIIGLN